MNVYQEKCAGTGYRDGHAVVICVCGHECRGRYHGSVWAVPHDPDDAWQVFRDHVDSKACRRPRVIVSV